ncbi:2-(3-amino-3-carboxypropyl)histidine synthase subunit 2 [Schistocerca serialis cubense]|uniref:2-(3-amino-3-carboxypropyl)histidine synthase subunit 2 n=1 Tax=Schistocerca serialis cubense TaxID=2023355 RepID=UPI00214F18AC|nr:2-(3-amino-3-carboxypropyl)histidine synthase subunit 2 [Schistocerca serialis cubense]
MTQFSSDGKAAIERTIEVDVLRERAPAFEVDTVYEIERCAEWIREIGAKTICLQFPDKLLPDSVDVSLKLQKLLAHNQVFILGDTSYGSCCVDEVTAQHVNADAIIHFGHACLSLTDRIPVLHIFEKYSLDIEQFVCEFTNNFQKHENLILLYDVAYEHCISRIRERLCSDYSNLLIPSLNISVHVEESNVICGRCFSVPRETVISDYTVVFLGKNERTFQNIVLELSGAKVFIFDPFDANVLRAHNVSNNKFLMKRMFLIEKVKDARIIGILVGTLGISKYLTAIDRIKNIAKERGKKCYIVVVGKPNVPKLANFPEIDVFVLLACPENSFTNERFFKPLVTAYDFELACNPNRPWSNIYLTNFQDFLCDDSDMNTSVDWLQYDLSNVSLTGGHLQTMEKYDEEAVNEVSGTSTVSLKSNTALSLHGASGSHFLASRSWRGLEQNLGQTKVEHASKGRSGIPMRYDNEPDS